VHHFDFDHSSIVGALAFRDLSRLSVHRRVEQRSRTLQRPFVLPGTQVPSQHNIKIKSLEDTGSALCREAVEVMIGTSQFLAQKDVYTKSVSLKICPEKTL
jgi:hypothetical protein